MAIELASLDWNNRHYTWTFSGSWDDIIVNQTQLYMDKAINQVNYRYYNSAIYAETYWGRIANYSIFLMTKTPQTLSVTIRGSSSLNVQQGEDTVYFTREISALDANIGAIFCAGAGGSFGGFGSDQSAITTNFGDIPVFTNKNDFVAYTQAPYINYQWSSVPVISGKNGILSLPVLIDTDRNPVSNGSASDFSTLPDSIKVRTLADLAVQ